MMWKRDQYTSYRRLQARYGLAGELWGSFTQNTQKKLGELWGSWANSG